MDLNRYPGSSLKPTTVDSLIAVSLLRLVDFCLIAVLFLAPLFMGGRHPLGRLVLVAIAAVMAIAWLLRQCFLQQAAWRSTAGQWLFLATCFLVLFQVYPLSPEWMTALSPSTSSLLSLWSQEGQAGVHFGNWRYLSLNPQLTIYGLSILFAYGAIFLVTVQRVKTISDVQVILKWIAFASIAMAVLGLIQYLLKDERYLWTYEHPFRKADGIQGTFTNANHFSHVLALGIGACVSWLFIRIKKPSADQAIFGGKARSHRNNGFFIFVAGLGVSIIVFTVLIAMSRGGIIALIVAVLTLAFVYKKFLDRRFIGPAFGVILLGSVLLAIHGGDDFAKEVNTLKELSVNQADYKQMRQAIWGANLKAIQAKPWFGHGIGTHRYFYKTYLEKPFPVEFSHAESGYMQVGSEAGVVGLGLLFVGIFVCGFWCVGAMWNNNNVIEVICIGAVASALVVSAVHSIVDFVWYIPACMSWTVILCGLGCRLYQMRRKIEDQPSFTLPRVLWLGVTIVVGILGIGSVQVLLRPARASQHWDNYSIYAKDRHKIESKTNAVASQSEMNKELLRVAEGLDKKLEEEMRAYLSKDLNNATAHLRMAAVFLRQFQARQRSSLNPMDIGQIRDAAIASQFPSKEALNEWLGRAIGENQELLQRALWHTRQAIIRCPLQGEAYLFLAELIFLEGQGTVAKSSLVDQAIRVRPFDGKVLLMAGKEAAVAGDVETAVGHWKKSFKYSIDGKLELLRLICQRLPASITIQMLEPEANDLEYFYRAYQGLGDPLQMAEVCTYFESLLWKVSVADQNVLQLWTTLSKAYQGIQKHEDALRCAKQALQFDSSSFHTRLLMASILFDLAAYPEAEQQLRWCVSRRPDHFQAQELLKSVVKARIAKRQSPNGTETR